MSKEPHIEKAVKDMGLRIVAFRKKRNMSRYRLSKQCGIEYASLLRIESGHTEARYTTLLKIVSGLEITTSEFFKDIDLTFF